MVHLKFQFVSNVIITAFLSLMIYQCDALSNSEFKRLTFQDGISLEVPSHWSILSLDTRRNLNLAGRSALENAGVEPSSSQKYTLLAVNASPSPTGAMIRLSVLVPPSISQDDLRSMSKDDLLEVDVETRKIFKALEGGGAIKVLRWYESRVEKIGRSSALVISYDRQSSVGTGAWRVTQYKIPTGNFLIELTLSNREADAKVWGPILERVKRSLRY